MSPELSENSWLCSERNFLLVRQGALTVQHEVEEGTVTQGAQQVVCALKLGHQNRTGNDF